ncbi:penicillin-binding protein 1A [Rhizomicrobium palustre]|uniref:Penicillin-binding protein 1A n=1 Tax=Rhizomicrobium palustre TaxID=189966 RepID=A0A846MXE5_9PROT|nr:PBP1A family penicillin-binding protein [Rhizomicrobium palustre]NIK87657.1 penicillin-binding protein 1A [Rhizomicrobium palustre]
MFDGFLRAGSALGEWIIRNNRTLLKIAVWAVGIITLPLLGLWLLPIVLGLIAPPLDRSQDLYALNRPVAFTFLDAKGEVIGRRGAAVGERLTLEQMPAYLPAAFIAMEDRRFYEHHAIDPRGIVRALVADIRARHAVAGGSTITEQTAKILYTNQERTLSRRLKTELDAAMLEKSLSKKEILELYLNRIYLGSGAYGVDGAAHIYFGKSARELSLAEAAMLATLTRAPSVFSPRRDLAAAQERADVVLSTMVETGAITEAQAKAAHDHPAVVVDRATAEARNYYLDAAREEALRLAQASGQAVGGDLTVRTTLEPKIQDIARRTAHSVITGKQGQKANAHEAAVVVMKPDGAVSAMIGGVDYTESTFNRAIQAHRQPGSAFKPFVYLAALEAGVSPWETREDTPISINGWTPTNFGGRSYGTIMLADALAHSVNTIAVQLSQEVGIDTVVDAAKRCGITSKLTPNASLALGTAEVTPLELTSAYATFASGGLRVRPYMVTQVNGPDGRTLYKRKDVPGERVVASHVNRDLLAMMFGVVSHGTGFSANLMDREAAGKTGTTQDYHDAWFVGFTTDYVTGVWVGNDDSSPMRNVTGGTLPAQIWKTVMKVAEAGLPPKGLDRSPPQDAENGEMTLESGPGGFTADDEAAINRTPQIEGQSEGPQEKKKSTGGLFNWLFGGDDKEKQNNQSSRDD